MRWPRFRFTLWRLMIAVAIVAFLIGGGIGSARFLRLRASHLSDAAFHARREAEELANVALFDQGRRAGAANATDRSTLMRERSSRLRVGYHADLKRKYIRAASRPWEAVTPDPKDPGEDLLWESMMVSDYEFPDDGSPPRKLELSPRLLELDFEEFLVEEKLTPAALEEKRERLMRRSAALMKEMADLKRERALTERPADGQVPRPAEIEIEIRPGPARP